MDQGIVDPGLAAELDDLRAQGFQVTMGSAPLGGTPHTSRGQTDVGPGSQVEIAREDTYVRGFGGTLDEAVKDAISKLSGYDPVGWPR